MLKNFNLRTKQNGFTLIELLLSIVIILILMGALIKVINPAAIRAKTRDSQRISDLRQIQAALELNFADNRSYPNTSGSWVNETAIPNLTNYLSPIPTDPSGGHYQYRSTGPTYFLVAGVEVDTSANGNCYGNTSFTLCHGVTNP